MTTNKERVLEEKMFCEFCKYEIDKLEMRYTKGRGKTKKYWHVNCLKEEMYEKRK